MGTLANPIDGSVYHLGTEALLGTSDTCQVRRAERFVSRMHASVLWRGNGWFIKDLRSRNGTYVNGERIGEGEHPLRLGDRIGLGSSEVMLVLREAGPPAGRARDLSTRAEVVSVDGVLSIPSAAEPDVVLYQDDEERAWVLDGRRVHSGSRVTAGGREWELLLPGTIMPTQGPASLSLLRAHARFQVSADFEHVTLTLTEGPQRIAFQSLVTLWPVYLLAEERLRDRAVDAHDQGWLPMERLEKKSDMDRRKIDIYVGRLKDLLVREGVADADLIVEVRRGQRRIGMAPERLTVEVARRDQGGRG